MSLTTKMEDRWPEIFNALIAKTKTVSDLKEVVDSEKERFDNCPAAYVCPSTLGNFPSTFTKSAWYPEFDIGVAVQNDDKNAGIRQAWVIALKIITVLITDRSLGHIVDNLEAVAIPYWRKLGIGEDEHWVGIKVKCTIWVF
jgi:hypothetical protein